MDARRGALRRLESERSRGKWREGAEPRLATRLALWLVVSVVVVMGVYMMISHRARRALLLESAVEEVRLVSTMLAFAAEDLLREGRRADLDELLSVAVRAKQGFAAIVVDSARTVVAGLAMDGCLQHRLPVELPAREVSGRAECGTGVHWRMKRLSAASVWLVVGVEDVLAERAGHAALRRQLLLLIALGITVATAMTLVLRRFMTQPLQEVVATLQALATTESAPPLRLASTARELGWLTSQLNETAEELRASRLAEQQKAEERLAMERRLAQAEKFAMIGRLSGGLAHELGSPLSVIGLRAAAIQQCTRCDHPIHEQARAITEEVERVGAFMQSLLHLSLRQRVVFERVDLRELVERVAAETAPDAAGAAVTTAVALPAEPVYVKGDAVMLAHALRNVLRNAVDAVRGCESPRLVAIGALVQTGSVLVTVDDNGFGIPRERLAHLFEPFHTTKAPGAGIGLGLPVSQGIIVEHGGEIRVENRPGGGVRVLIRLPRSVAGEGVHV